MPNNEFLVKTPLWFDEFYESLTAREVYSLKTSEIINRSGKSREHLSRLFKAATGQTIGNYLNDLRIEHAAAMLTTTYLDIINIALESGFENLSTFYHLFKKKKGISPNQYRKRYSFIY
ncbi:MAG: helix-turn-helix transcriptional regulator [Clostridia bacterium]|nr:helix-turn-helix transcriptional regulator [Clostridia bacterium]